MVVAILGVIAGKIFTDYLNQAAKAQDVRRKEDLAQLKVAFEDYYMDKNCYPQNIPNCGQVFAPYLKTVPCEPVSRQNYPYKPGPGSCPQYYWVFTNLTSKANPEVAKSGCPAGCGPGGKYNWGITSENKTLTDYTE